MSGTEQYPQSAGYRGASWLTTRTGGYNALDFLVRQVIAGKAFSGLVKVIGVQPGGTNGRSTVTVQPMVNQVDGFGNATPHGNVYNIPVFRQGAGVAAMIIEPAIGDIGHAIICDRDISNVKTNSAVSNPGSARQHDWADGLYYGCHNDNAVTTYVQMDQGNITMHCPGNINITAGGTINITASGDMAILSAQTSIDNKPFLPHEHTLVVRGGDDTGPVA